jgi:hypothetical protein
MSGDASFILKVIPRGAGFVPDLGERQACCGSPFKDGAAAISSLTADASRTESPHSSAMPIGCPLKTSSWICWSARIPWVAVKEVHRVLKEGGKFIIWVPFMHPFHGHDFYRYSPLGLRHLLGDFELVASERPFWVFTVVGLTVIEALKRMHLGVQRGLLNSCAVRSIAFLCRT